MKANTIRDFGFENKNPESGFREFNAKIGDGNRWFSELLQAVHKIKINRPITDIMIRENQVVRLGTNKMYVPFHMKFDGNILKPSDEQLLYLVKSLTNRETRDIEKVSNIEFDIAIYGNGVYRVNVSRDYLGIAIVIRCLDFEILEFEKLIYPPFYKHMIKGLVTEVDMPNFAAVEGQKDRELTLGYINGGGLILHCGPTGSGKSTHMSSEINYLGNRINGAILTYEDPIEQRFLQTSAIVRQFRLGEDICPEENLTLFEVIKHNMLRNNPSICMISEARTLQEIYHVLEVANSGHVVFSTMHPKNTTEALSLLLAAAGENKQLLSTALHAVVFHYLYHTLRGRLVPLYEVFIPNRMVKTHIEGNDPKKLSTICRAFYEENTDGKVIPGCMTFSQHIELMIGNGTIPENEFERVTTSMRNTLWDYDNFMQRRQSKTKLSA